MTELNKDKIKASVHEVWTKLEGAIQHDLNDVLAGKAGLTASTTASVVKFIQLSSELSKDPSFDTYDYSHIKLPTFDDGDEYAFR